MNRYQENTVDWMTIEHKRVSVREGFDDSSIRVTVPTGIEYRVTDLGHATQVGYNHSVDWSLRCIDRTSG